MAEETLTRAAVTPNTDTVDTQESYADFLKKNAMNNIPASQNPFAQGMNPDEPQRGPAGDAQNPAIVQAGNGVPLTPTGQQQKISGLDLNGLTAAGKQQAAGLTLEAKGITAEQALTAKSAKDRADAYNTMLAAQKTDQDAQKAQTDTFMNTMQTDMDTLRNTKITTPDIWANMGTGQKVLAGVSMFLSALTPEGTKNTVNMIENTINRDVKMQELNLQSQKEGLSNKMTLFKMNMDKYKDIELARQATTMGYNEMLKSQLESQVAAARGDQVRGKLQAGIGALNERITQQKNNFEIAAMNATAKSGKVNPRLATRKEASGNAFNELDRLENMVNSGERGITDRFVPGMVKPTSQYDQQVQSAASQISAASGIPVKEVLAEMPLPIDSQKVAMMKIARVKSRMGRMKQSLITNYSDGTDYTAETGGQD